MKKAFCKLVYLEVYMVGILPKRRKTQGSRLIKLEVSSLQVKTRNVFFFIRTVLLFIFIQFGQKCSDSLIPASQNLKWCTDESPQIQEHCGFVNHY